LRTLHDPHRHEKRPITEDEMTATASVISRTSSQSWSFEEPLPRGIVVAVDESAESIEAFRMATDIATARDWNLHVISVVPPFSSYDVIPDLTGRLPASEVLRMELRSAAVRDVLDGCDAKTHYSYEVTLGRPTSSIVSVAECRGAELIVAGRTRHNPLERLIGSETTLQMMRISRVPVLAVSTAVKDLSRVVVATDFSESSVKAACVAAEVMGGSGTIHLVYVDEPQEVIAGIPVTYEGRSPSDIVAWFRRTSSMLAGSPGLRVEPTVLTGTPVQVLTEFAERVGAGMIAAGSHGYSRIERFLLGSVSTGLVRNAPCPVLIARSAL
jgi:nucleotide-binding universal stress UspA family protein